MRVLTLRPESLTQDIVAGKVQSYRSALEAHPDNPAIHSGLICHLDTLNTTSVEDAQANRREWHARHKLPRFDHWPNDPAPDRKLKVGYVSCDFRRTSAAYAFGPVVLDHDRDRFDITCYSVKDKPGDAFRNVFKGNADHWRAVESADDLVIKVREDGIDILVDLVGHIAGNILPALTAKPAPIQVTAWGCLGGTGCPEVDYLLSDPITTPSEDRRHYAETIVDLPCALSYMPVPGCPDVQPPPYERNGFVTFGFLGRLLKADDATFQRWALILRNAPSSKLLIKSKRLDDDVIRSGVVKRFGELGIDRDRLDLRGETLHKAHLSAHHDVDVLLDALPHNGGISALEAMWMGVPLVTVAGQGPHGRVGASLLNAVGLFGGRTEREYVLTALAYARDPAMLTSLRGSLRQMIQRSWLCRPARTVEQAYREMWGRWCSGEAERNPTQRSEIGSWRYGAAQRWPTAE